MNTEHNSRDFIINFYHRFVCGGEALTHLRSVSRKRLELSKLNLSQDIEAQSLLSRINAYKQTMQTFYQSTDISNQLLIQIHKQLNNTQKQAGYFRQTQQWTGGIPAGTLLKKALKNMI